MKAHKLSIDTTANAAYFQLTDGEVNQTKEVNPLIQIDLDNQGQILGIEFLSLEILKDFDRNSLIEFVSSDLLNELTSILNSPLRDQLNSSNLSFV